MTDHKEVQAALNLLVGSSCLVKRKEHGDLRGRISGIAVECIVENLEQSIDLTIFKVDLGFGDIRELAGSELSFNKKG